MEGASRYQLPRFLFQRGLGLIYLIAFLFAVNQFRPLLGEHGLLPQVRKERGEWWQRELVGPRFPEVSLDTPGFRRILLEQGWL
jgi:hypothetical protein